MNQSSQNPRDNSSELAWAAYESGRYELSLQYAFEALSLNPGNANLHLLASSACLGLGRHLEARQLAKQMIELAPASWLGYQALAWLAGGSFFFAALGAYWSPWILAFWCLVAMVYFPIGIIVLSAHRFAKLVQLINLILTAILLCFGVLILHQSAHANDGICGIYMLIGAGLLALAGPTLHFRKFSPGEVT